ASGAEQVRPLLPAGSGSLALVTSRDALAGLAADGAVPRTLDVLTRDEAHDLLTGLLGAARVGAEPVAAAELAHLCAYLPLAVRIAAANLPDRESLGAYTARLRAGNRLAALEVEGDREAAVRVAFELSYAGLPAPARRLFRLLGLIPGSDVTAEAAAALAGGSVAEVRPVLERLAAVIHAAANGPRPMAWLLCDAMRRYLYVRGYLVDLLAVGRAGLAAATAEGARAAQAICQLTIGNHYQYRNRYDEAVEHLSQLRDIGREIGWAEARSSALSQLGAVYAMMGRPRRAVEQLTEALTVNRRLGITIGLSNDNALLGMVYRDLGELDLAREYLTEALRLYREIGSRVG